MSARAFLAATIALAGAADGVRAQALNGVVLLPDSVTPAPAILVVANDEQGRIRARAITDERGRFTLDAGSSGRVIVRALRVGYQPSALPPIDLSATPMAPLRLVLGLDAVRLEAITVRGADRCRRRDDARARIADVWEEARKALLHSNTSRRDDPMIADWTRFDRMLDSLGRRVLDESVDRTREPSEQPFVSRPADSLAALGYVTEDSAGVSFYAPDAEVLLSDSFAGSHCFQLVEGPPAGEALIGLRFQPIADSRDRRDIEGTIWLARSSAELRFLEFAYTEMPAAALRAEPGGRVEFKRLVDGSWLVSRWELRMPELHRVAPVRAGIGRIRVVSSAIAMRGVKVVGGEVTRVERGGVVLFETTGAERGPSTLPSRSNAVVGELPRREMVPAAVEFTVADSLGHPIADVAIVAIDAFGKHHDLRSDSAGRAELDSLPLGAMRVEARRPGYYLVFGTVRVVEGVTPASVVLERMQGGAQLDTVLISAERDEARRFAGFESRLRSGAASLSITSAQIERRDPVSTWQLLLTANGVQLIEGPEGVLAVSRRTNTMDLIDGKACYMRLAIDGLLLPDDPVNLARRMPPPPDIHRIEVFNGPATIPPEFGSNSRGLLCGLIAVWTK